MIYPDAFAHYRQFILYKIIPVQGAKSKKLPVNPHTLQPYPKDCDWQGDPAYWTDGHTATALLPMAGPSYGLGFLFTPDDPFFFVDIDKCLTAGQWSDTARNILAMFPGCAVEVSQSGTGLHIFGTGKPAAEHSCRNDAVGIEFYTQFRYVALTGTHKSGDAATVCSPDNFIATYLPPKQATEGLGWTTEPVEGYTHLDDDELIRKACRSGGTGSIFGGRATFGDLWHCNERVLSKAYPSQGSFENFDRSRADAALAQHLAFWTGRNCERIRELMPRSQLVRDKWDRDDYMIRTIEGAVSRQTDVYTGPDRRRDEQLAQNIEIGDDEGQSLHTPILSLDDMIAQLVFIGGDHAVGHMPSKRLRKKAAAADEYAASYHTFIDPDTRAEKATPAFKAWLSSPKRLSVECATWWPGASEICPPPEGHGLAFNTWRGLKAPGPVPDDWNIRVMPFVNHIEWLCGDEAEHFTMWLAHMFQRPAVLPHTCYLHVTPTTGIGRNWVAGVLCRALRGYVAAGVDIGKVLDGKFNGRLSRKLMAIVDEVREGGDYAKRAVRGEKLKAVITEEVREIDPKYGVQTIERNCCRWLMFSQHQDALPFENSDRRVIVVNNPTQRQSPEYYGKLYGMLHDPAFIASVWQYLLTYDISEYNPSLPAPLNEAKQHALESMASETDFALDEFLRTWPADVATMAQIQEYVGPVNDGHLRHALNRAGRHVLPTRVKLATGQRSRVVVVRGDRADVEHRTDLQDAVIAAEVAFKFRTE